MFNEQQPVVFNPFVGELNDEAISEVMMNFVASAMAAAKGIKGGKLNFLDAKYNTDKYSLKEKLAHATSVPDIALPAHFVSAVFLERVTPSLILLLPQGKTFYNQCPDKYRGNYIGLLFLHWLIMSELHRLFLMQAVNHSSIPGLEYHITRKFYEIEQNSISILLYIKQLGGDVVIYPDDLKKTASALREDFIDPFINWAADIEVSQMLIIPGGADPVEFIQESTEHAGDALTLLLKAIPPNAIMDDLKGFTAYYSMLMDAENKL